MSAPDPKDVKARLALARLAKDKRDEAAQEAADLAELVELELETKYTAELGARGAAFEIIMSDEAPIVVKLGPGVLFSKFEKAIGKDSVGPVEIEAFVAPCIVEPAVETWREIVARRPVIGTRCSNALVTLFGAKKVADQKKF